MAVTKSSSHDKHVKAGQAGAHALSHEQRVEIGKKAAATRGHDELSKAGKKGGEHSHGGKNESEK